MKLKKLYIKLEVNNLIYSSSTIASRKTLDKYENVVIATYSDNNFYKKNDLSKKIFQFELCEKIVVKLLSSLKILVSL